LGVVIEEEGGVCLYYLLGLLIGFFECFFLDGMLFDGVGFDAVVFW